MSRTFFPLTPVGKTKLRINAPAGEPREWNEFDVFNTEVDDSTMKRVRDALVQFANGYFALEWVVNNHANVVRINGTSEEIWELYLPGRGLPTAKGTSRDDVIAKAMNAVAEGRR